jgi:hypothetical protein
MAQQRSMSRAAALTLTSPARLLRLVRASPCDVLSSAAHFDGQCSVQKREGVVTCDHLPDVDCHVKDATLLMRRMGDMGKVPTSAALHIWNTPGAMRRELEWVLAAEANPSKRAALLVQRFARVYRVGRKLSAMFVSALSVPALAPALTPWHPDVDGSALVVVDTNVAQVVELLRPSRAMRSKAAVAAWVRDSAMEIDLRVFRPDLPAHSPRLVQQAMYHFRSRSNRLAHADSCAANGRCGSCVETICPFARSLRGGASPVTPSALPSLCNTP